VENEMNKLLGEIRETIIIIHFVELFQHKIHDNPIELISITKIIIMKIASHVHILA
jgi:hypothetical protein